MCRIFAIQADETIAVGPWIQSFADACESSTEYQGHGWGVAWRERGRWQRYRSVEPIWESTFVLPPTSLAVIHARSAFRNEGIVVENNMPFMEDEVAFAFNGELRGVRLSTPGATGAARLQRLLMRFAEGAGGDIEAAMRRLDGVITTRSEYVRALNLVVSDGQDLYVHSRYSEDPDYFTLHRAELIQGTGIRLVCSEQIGTAEASPEWVGVENGSTCRLQGGAPCFS